MTTPSEDPPARPLARLEDVLATSELARRPAREPNLLAEIMALHQLAQRFATRPLAPAGPAARPADALLQALVDAALALCHAGTAGISLLETTPDGATVFRWTHVAGVLTSYTGGYAPRALSPCGVTLERGTPQLFTTPERYFSCLAGVDPPIIEGLVVPLSSLAGAGDTANAVNIADAVGTIWVLSHTDERRFDGEDARVLSSLAGFTAAALRLTATATENARLYAEIRQSLQQRNYLLAALSHDLRTPLATIKGYTQRLRRQSARRAPGAPGAPSVPVTQCAFAGEPSRVDSDLAAIDDAASRLAAQLDELDDLAHVLPDQPRPVSLQRSETDLVALARRIVETHNAAEAPALGHPPAVVVDTCAEELIGRWDQVRLARALDNLLVNATKYSPRGAPVTVRLWRDGPAAMLEVEDQGIGIPQDDLPHIFAPFRRATNVGPDIPGTGLGLASTRWIVEAHGGHARVTSQLGKGTTVSVRLPLSPDGEEPRP